MFEQGPAVRCENSLCVRCIGVAVKRESESLRPLKSATHRWAVEQQCRLAAGSPKDTPVPNSVMFSHHHEPQGSLNPWALPWKITQEGGGGRRDSDGRGNAAHRDIISPRYFVAFVLRRSFGICAGAVRHSFIHFGLHCQSHFVVEIHLLTKRSWCYILWHF